jgi:hypothetical protein
MNRIARPLKVLVPLIQQDIAAAEAAGLEHYRRAEALHAAHGDIDTEYRKLGANLLQELEALRKKGG